ncbi:trypsin-like peptidase domain-containing protein [Streptomyces sp. NPDC048664]|uniref:trypsin-like serine peptidase n=1 Tax=Streptomyces sp. NPDC048664 TaxID=3154505 RepID=UPI0034489B0B
MGKSRATTPSRRSRAGRTGSRLRISAAVGAAITVLGAAAAPARAGTAEGGLSATGHRAPRPTTLWPSAPEKSSSEKSSPERSSSSSRPPGTSAAPSHQAFGGSDRAIGAVPKSAVGYLATDFDYRGTSFLPHYTQCSATAVAPDVIATAAHCVVRSNGEKAGDREVFFRPGLDANRQPRLAEYFRSSKVLVDPRYRAAEGSWEHTAYDIAYVVLGKKDGRSVGDVAGWVPSKVDKALVGKRMTIIGYPENQGDRYRPHVCDKPTQALEPNRGHGEAQVLWGTGTCANLGNGASGGPWFARQGGQLTLVGVNHGTFSRDSENAAAGAAFNDTSWRLFQSALRTAADDD